MFYIYANTCRIDDVYGFNNSLVSYKKVLCRVIGGHCHMISNSLLFPHFCPFIPMKHVLVLLNSTIVSA